MMVTDSKDLNQDNPLLVVRDNIATIFLNSPDRKNALPLSAWQQFPDLVTKLQESRSVRVCIIRGMGGKSFCAGADIVEFEAVRSSPQDAKTYDEINVRAFKALKNIDIPVIAAIDGPCLGGGLGLALACDIRIAATSAYFGIPAARLGLAYPPEAIGDLLDAVSPSDAKQLLFTGERITAERAAETGLVSLVVATSQLEEKIESLCNSICANAPLSLKAAKHAVNQLTYRQAGIDPGTAFRNAEKCIESEDYREGCRAFLEKRSPVFKGR